MSLYKGYEEVQNSTKEEGLVLKRSVPISYYLIHHNSAPTDIFYTPMCLHRNKFICLTHKNIAKVPLCLLVLLPASRRKAVR